MNRPSLALLIVIVFCCTLGTTTNIVSDESYIVQPSFSPSQGTIDFHFISPFEGEILSGNITVKVKASLIDGSPVLLRWNTDSWINLTDWYNVTSKFFEYPLDVTCLPTGNVTFEAKQETDHGTMHDSVEATIEWYRPPILIVSDYYDLNISDYYTSALEALGFDNVTGYSLWHIPTNGSPIASDLLDFQLVVWFTGADGGALLGPERSAIQTYLNDESGHKMLLTGTEIAWRAYQVGFEAWLSSNFGVNDYVGDSGNTGNLLGSLGTPYEGTNYTYGGGDGSQMGGGMDWLRTMEASIGLFEFPSSSFDEFAATQSPYVDGIFFGFAFDAISTSDNRTDLMNRTLNYLGLYAPPQVNILSPSEGDLCTSPYSPTWESSHDLHPIVYNPTYKIFVDGHLIVSDLTTETYPLTISEGNHTIRVVCEDNYGQRAYDNVSVVIDSTDPSNELNSHPDGSILKSGSLLEFNITDIHLEQVVAGWDSDTWTSFTSPYQTYLPTGDGTHIFHVNSTDSAGNWNYTQFTLICDDTLPTVSLTSLLNGTCLQSGVSINLQIADTYLNTATYRWDLDEDSFFSIEYETALPIGDGIHDLSVNATDIAGNQRLIHYQFITDDTLPTISLLSISNQSVLQTGSPIDLEILDSNHDTVRWVWDSTQSFYSTESTFETNAPIIEGEHWLYVYSNDSAGNTHFEWYMFMIDNTPPEIALSSPDDGGPILGGSSITVSVQDTHLESVYVRWDLGGWDEWSSPYLTISPVEDGFHSLFVNATDIAGNWIQVVFVFHIDNGFTTITTTTTTTSTSTTTTTTTSIPPVDLPTNLGILGIGIGLGVAGCVIVLQLLTRRKIGGSPAS